jgi:polysaccharide biosynthesis protein PelC
VSGRSRPGSCFRVFVRYDLNLIRCRIDSWAVASIRLAAILVCAWLAGGCVTRTISTGTRYDPPGPEPDATLAVVPFENLSRHRNAGLILTDLATSALYAQQRFQLVEVSRLVDDESVRFRRVETTPWERQVGVNTAAAAAVGRALSADWVLAGSVGEYGFVDGFGETANVGLTLRLVRVADEHVFWAGSLSRRAACSAFNEDSIHRLAHAVLRDLLDRMVRESDQAVRANPRTTP